MAQPLQIWRLSDQRAGHDNQSLGLIEALSQLRTVETTTFTVSNAWQATVNMLGARRQGACPQLVIGAGHATHGALLAAAWRQRARSIVLMKPSLPCWLFDLCILPVHDGGPQADNVMRSIGALNRVRPARQRDAQLGLILVGGPSRHHRWNDDALHQQIVDLITARADMHWVITSSPRTPTTTTELLRAMPTIEFVPFDKSEAGWLPEQMARAATVWVSEDSVSMAYEAASSGAALGLLRVAARNSTAARKPRVVAALEALRESGRVIDTARWCSANAQTMQVEPLREAERCAKLILERWPDLH